MQQEPGCRDHRELRGRIRAYRRDDATRQLERRLIMLGIGIGPFAANSGEISQRLARALRHERRAARAGGAGYDPLRHLVLARLARAQRDGPLGLEQIVAASTAPSRDSVSSTLAARRRRT